MKRKRNHLTEYWVCDVSALRTALVYADGRPIILKDRKTAERFVAEMGMEGTWKAERAIVSVPETRGRRIDYDSQEFKSLRRAHLDWVMMEPAKRPKGYEQQRAFVEKHFGKLKGNPSQIRFTLRARIKAIRRFHANASSNGDLNTLLSA